MTPEIFGLALALGQIAFLAGGAWFLVRQQRRDLNGLGAKLNRLVAEQDRQFRVLALLLLAEQEGEARRRTIDRLLSIANRS